MKVRLVQLATLVGGTVVLLDYFVELAFIERTAAAFLHWSSALGSVQHGSRRCKYLAVHWKRIESRGADRYLSSVLVVSS